MLNFKKLNKTNISSENDYNQMIEYVKKFKKLNFISELVDYNKAKYSVMFETEYEDMILNLESQSFMDECDYLNVLGILKRFKKEMDSYI